MKEMWDEGEVKATTRCWAQGMEGWRQLSTIPQLKWLLCATGLPIMNDTDLAVICLNMLIEICKYYPNRCVNLFTIMDMFIQTIYEMRCFAGFYIQMNLVKNYC